MNTFTPRLDILPPPQRKVWPELASVPPRFVLYGGTAIALRLGHRSSVDFDFFTSTPFSPADLLREMAWLEQAQPVQSEPNTLTVSLHRGGPVKLSFFGGLRLGRVGEPERTNDGVLVAASLLDLAGTKAAVIQQRAERRDHLDIAALLETGIRLEEALGAAQALYRDQFNPMISLKALSYFADGDLPQLPKAVQDQLCRYAAGVKEITPVARSSDSLGLNL